ncbi:MAG: SulP family inorganic anion transporter [Pseudomonadota bacterium]
MSQPLTCDVRWIRWFPFLRWLHLLDRGTLRADILAGLTGAVIVLPQGVAFAMIAGLPPEYGLYTAIIPPIIAALFGSSFHLISGPTTAISIVVFSSISPLAEPGSTQYITLVLTLTLLAGVFQLLLGMVRLGTLVNFVSHTVVVGFTAGAAILIASSQLGHVFGIELESGASFLETWVGLVRQLPELNPHVLAVALATLVTAILFKRLLPRWPYMLLAMLAGTGVALLLDAHRHGIPLVGELPAHLPPLSAPDLSLGTIRELAPAALAVALLGLVEAVSIARSVAAKSHQRIDGNQEFIGQGLANITGAFFSSYASSGSFTRTGVNYEAGARTPFAAITAALSLAAILLLIAPLTAYLPIPAMSGILLLVAWNLIDWHHIRHIVSTSRSEAGVLATTFLATLFLHLEFAIYVGVMLSLVLYLSRTSRPTIATMAPDPGNPRRTMVNTALKPVPQCPQLRIVRLDGSLFFGAIDHVAGQFQQFNEANPEQKHILVLCHSMNFVDVAGAELLIQEGKRLEQEGGGLYLCNVKHSVRTFLESSGVVAALGDDHLFSSKGAALAGITQRLDGERCGRCHRRIFSECRDRPSPDGVADEGQTSARHAEAPRAEEGQPQSR